LTPAGSAGAARLHILGDATPTEAALFLVSSLLVSHGIRGNTAAAVRLGKRWVIARGDRIRHLRPDLDTAEGWVRAALRGRSVGAILSEEPPSPIGDVYVVTEGPCNIHSQSLEILLGFPLTLCYTRTGDCPLDAPIAGIIQAPGPPWLAAAIVNVALDRLEASLDPCPAP